jgi:hypothetical protein
VFLGARHDHGALVPELSVDYRPFDVNVVFLGPLVEHMYATRVVHTDSGEATKELLEFAEREGRDDVVDDPGTIVCRSIHEATPGGCSKEKDSFEPARHTRQNYPK